MQNEGTAEEAVGSGGDGSSRDEEAGYVPTSQQLPLGVAPGVGGGAILLPTPIYFYETE